MACSSFIDHFGGWLERHPLEELRADDCLDWIAQFQLAVAELAEKEELRARDFACTLLAALVGTEHAAYFQVGDGAIVRTANEDAPDAYDCVFWPQRGEYENTTNFVTDLGVAERFNFGLVHEQVEELALFTDGIQPLVLHYRTRSAHAPFFAGVFAVLRQAQETGHSIGISKQLRSYLDSDRINAATDDDKTLIIASRRTMEQPATGA